MFLRTACLSTLVRTPYKSAATFWARVALPVCALQQQIVIIRFRMPYMRYHGKPHRLFVQRPGGGAATHATAVLPTGRQAMKVSDSFKIQVFDPWW